MATPINYLGQVLDSSLVQEIARASKRKLSPAKLEGLTKPRFYGDGGNLWLQVAPGGGRSWVFRYMVDGKAKVMGLGSLGDVALTEARARATICRRLLRDGIDPREERDRLAAEAGRQRRAAGKASKTLQEAFDDYVATHRTVDEGRREPHRWGYATKKDVLKAHGAVAVADISDDMIADMLQPIWHTKPQTAKKARLELAQILDFAKVKKWRTGENPARAVAGLTLQLGKQDSAPAHFKALPYDQMAEFWAKLASREETAAEALRFTILTGARTNETVGATWDEIDLDAAVWTVPAARMKGGKEHRVALSKAAVEVLKRMEPRTGKWVFPGLRSGQPLSRAAMDAVLKRMSRKDGVTVHGFRSTFADWAWEVVGDRNTASAALAHAVGDKVERAYRRGDALEKRRRMMEAWAAHCEGHALSDNVVEIGRRAS